VFAAPKCPAVDHEGVGFIKVFLHGEPLLKSVGVCDCAAVSAL
jgi:hypothetical protein